MILKEKHLGIKWELIHMEMMFENIELCWDSKDKIILGKLDRILDEYSKEIITYNCYCLFIFIYTC